MIFIGIILMIICSALISLGQLLFKLAASEVNLEQPWKILFNKKILIGIGSYFLFFFLSIVAYRYGDLIVLFPITILNLVWNIFLAKRFLGESFTQHKIVGTAVIITGCVILALSSV